MSSIKYFFIALAWVGLSSTAEAAGSDSWITTKLKLDLATSSNISARDVHVDTIDGKVTLHGTVDTTEQKQKAESIAKGIDGVREVRNLLQVVPKANQKAVEQADDRIEKEVSNLLKSDPALKDSSIKVKSVNKGMVLLSGKANTVFDHLRAVESALSIAGVRSVASEVASTADLPDLRKTKFTTDAKHSAKDSWITTAVKMRLLADPKVPALAINVDTYDGAVTLFGMVSNPAAKAAAVAQAKKVDAAVAVKDEIQVVPESQQEFVEAKDDAIQSDIRAAFKKRDDLKGIDVTVQNGVVHLTGNAGTGWQRLQAAIIARGAKGVRSVEDDVHIEPRG